MKIFAVFALATLSAQAVVPPYDGKNFMPEVSGEKTGFDASPAGYDWPLVTMRQMSSTCYDEKTMKDLIAIHSKYPGGCGEIWLAESYPRVLTSMVARATALGDLAPRIRAAGMRVGFQQGVTLGHDFSARPVGGRLFPEDAYQVDVDGKKTAFLCPTSPDVLKCEEEYAESLAGFAAAARRGAKRANPDVRMGYQAIGSWTLVRPTVADEPLALSAGEGDEVRFTLPDLLAAAMCTVVF